MKLASVVVLAAAVWLVPGANAAARRAPSSSPISKAAPAAVAARPDTIHVVEDSFVVARVGPRTITALTFRNRYFLGADAGRPGRDSSGRAEFLERMIDKEVLGLTALEVNPPLTFEDRLTMKSHTTTVLQNVLYERKVQDSVRVTNQDIDAHIHQFTYEQHLRVILFDDRATAERVRREILRGRLSWGEAARRYDRNRNAAPDGDIGWVRRGSMRGELALNAFELAPGAYSEVFLAPEGYRIIQCIARRPNKIPSMQYARMVLMADLRQARARPYSARFYDWVRLSAGVVYDTTTLLRVADKFRERLENPPTRARGVIDMSPDLPEFDDADTGLVMARTKYRKITVGQFLDDLEKLPGSMRPQFASLEPLIHRLDGPALAHERVELALALGIDRDSMALAQIENRRELILVDHLFQDSVLSQVSITTEDRRRYYDQHRDDMKSPARVLQARILCRSEGEADAMVSRLRAGERAEDIVKERSLLGDDSTASIFMVSEREHDEFAKDLFEELKPGQCKRVGPDRQGLHLVIQVLEHYPSRDLQFDEVGGQVDENLQNIEAERLLKEFVARRRTHYPIKAEHGMLMRIWLTDPTLDYLERRRD